ncbi:anti-sigma-28 factor, FlgM family [Clostridium sp. USBA 49]|jgi:negative regulator of flagellin synthesis FlgM|uniref:flagellar biosynthesis anti-sigma factor FlgM n=1 Tax=Clostridium TaxID=1485 RepID=UPI000998F456|nr:MULTISPECIES: flagellar biosynthesis anti-sigma factor FlgM [Clostridium]SKA72725.1 anti-sigma-28 factor, FlgM family [Clostridium sp. USBA 49]
MKINGLGINKGINSYKNNSKPVEKKSTNFTKDTVELSSLAKSLSSLKEEETFNSNEKIEKLQREISKGTYKPNSKLIAKSIIENMKGKGV